jgi:hypothetical protein
MSASDIVAAIAAGIALVSLGCSAALYRLARRTEAREATAALMTEWWGPELAELRRYYRTEFADFHSQLASGGEMPFRELERRLRQEGHGSELRRLCFFFDRVGWLGASGLVNVDYVLTAFQHYVKDLWLTMQPFVEQERRREYRNPIFLFGFEWLNRRTAEPGKDQAHLIRVRFRDPRLVTRDGEELLRIQIDDAAARPFRAPPTEAVT